MNSKLFFVFIYLLICGGVHGFTDYIKKIGKFLGYKDTAADDISVLEYNHKIPYEVSVVDEKFISEAAKLTGVALSELDTCQQRVVMKLKQDCNKMNDEQLAKMGVHLLNCQSYVEGRQMYPCNDEMSIKDCTTKMDSDTWTSYHLMTNRVRAVCYTIRQSQFRGLAEHTVNKLMEAAQRQLSTLGKIANDQENIQSIAQDTLDTVAKGHEDIISQQKDLHRAQLHGQFILEDNIRRLGEEKHLISESHERLASLTQSVRSKLEEAAKQLENQADESRTNHRELINDLIAIQNQAHIIFQRIEDSSNQLIKQSEMAKKQYEQTLAQLAEVNLTVHGLVKLVGSTKQALEERLAWITSTLGGTDLAMERLYLFSWHSAFLIVAMVVCAFLSARTSTRLLVSVLPPLNLALSLRNMEEGLDPINLAMALGALIVAQSILLASVALWNKEISMKAIPWFKSSNTNKNSEKENISNNDISTSHSLSKEIIHEDYEDNVTYSRYETDSVSFNEFGTPTPPLSRNSNYLSRSRSRTPLLINGLTKGSCRAKTRLGTPCKLSALPGREFCYRHKTGDSVIMS